MALACACARVTTSVAGNFPRLGDSCGFYRLTWGYDHTHTYIHILGLYICMYIICIFMYAPAIALIMSLMIALSFWPPNIKWFETWKETLDIHQMCSPSNDMDGVFLVEKCMIVLHHEMVRHRSTCTQWFCHLRYTTKISLARNISNFVWTWSSVPYLMVHYIFSY